MSRREETEEWLGEPGRLNMICAHLANGGDLIALVQAEGVRYSDVVLWLNRDPGRKEAFEHSLDAQRMWMVKRLLHELESLALVDIRRAYDEHGALLPVGEIPEDVARCIVSMETVEVTEKVDGEEVVVGQVRKVKVTDKLKGIELYGKNLRMFVDQHEVGGAGSFADAVREAAARRKQTTTEGQTNGDSQ